MSDLFDKHYDLESRTIFLHGPITDNSATDFIKALHLMEQDDPDEWIDVKIMTEGGEFYPAMAICAAIQDSTCRIHGYVQGYCMSAGAIILQTMTRRTMSATDTMMIHDGFDASEGTPSDVKAWTKHNTLLGQWVHQLFAKRTGKSERYWRTKGKSDYVITADKALAEGLVDNVQ